MRGGAREWLRSKRVRGYLRVSTAGQADKYGPLAQRRDEEAAATEYGTLPIGRFYEDHVSGREALRRSDFQRMLADANRGEFDVLLVGRVDRFARNERDGWNYLHALEEAGVAVYFCEEDVLVPHDDGWQDQIGAEVNAAAAYSRKLSRNVRKGLRAKRASGGHIGGVPFGYRRGEAGRIEPDPATAPIRALAIELYATSPKATCRSVADELNRLGHRFMSGRLFTANSVVEILSNPVGPEPSSRSSRLRSARRTLPARRSICVRW